VFFHLPAPHGVHVIPSGPVYPALQVHFVCRGLPTAENVLLGHAMQFVAFADEYVSTPQDVQATEPVVFLYVPALQPTHSTPSAPVYPAMQVQDVSRGLLAADKVLFGHAVQDSVALRADEYVSTSQGVHVPTPVVFLYVPALQGVQTTPSNEAMYPARQVQIELFASENVLFGQAIQLVRAVDATSVE
jgi:hypothetical protein